MKYLLCIILSLCFFLYGGIVVAQSSIEQKVDVLLSEFQQQIDQRVQKISSSKMRENHEKRLWKRYNLLLNRQIKLWESSEKIVYQVAQIKILERGNDYLLQSISDLILQQELINAINNYRKKNNLNTVLYSSKLSKIAYVHALDLSNNFPYDTDGDGIAEVISHIWTDGSRVWMRAQKLEYYDYIVENIAYNQTTAYQVLHDRSNSTLHNDNILSSKVTHIWISKIGKYWVLVMGME